MKPRDYRRAGLAGSELVFILALILLLGSLAFPLFIEWRNYRGGIRAHSELRLLITAADLFNREYRLWPAPDAASRNDARYGWGRDNAAVIRILRAEAGPGNEAHRANPNRIDFIRLAIGPATLYELTQNAEGEVLDPWGKPYQMVFDSNYDTICAIPESSYGAVVGEGVVMWSMGPDRKSDTGDDLRTWVVQ